MLRWSCSGRTSTSALNLSPHNERSHRLNNQLKCARAHPTALDSELPLEPDGPVCSCALSSAFVPACRGFEGFLQRLEFPAWCNSRCWTLIKILFFFPRSLCLKFLFCSPDRSFLHVFPNERGVGHAHQGVGQRDGRQQVLRGDGPRDAVRPLPHYI